MRKVFPLKVPGKVDARVVENVKADVRRYVKRERGKPLPAGFDTWDFACRVGPSSAAATARRIPELSAAIDEVLHSGAAEVYVEIIASPGHRVPGADTAPSSGG